MTSFSTITIIVLDGFGVGGAPDADKYGDSGADTLGHLAEYKDLRLRNLFSLGLANLKTLHGVTPALNPLGCYGVMREMSKGKGSTEGHWEIAGCLTEEPFILFPGGFPEDMISQFSSSIGRGILGNEPASGTEIIDRLGELHCETGKPIVYTSADSVFQITACEDVVPLPQLYEWCETARAMLTGKWNVIRVIARPFIRQGDKFVRTTGRKDYSVEPTDETVLDTLKDAGIPVIGVGKIDDLFAGRGLTRSYLAKSNSQGMEKTIELTAQQNCGLIFTNLVDFDMKYGHRNDPDGYITALEIFDRELGDLMRVMKEDQLLILTSDHGCDPLFDGWDHTREQVPLLAYSPRMNRGVDLGRRETFADVAATVAENFSVTAPPVGKSFMDVL